MRKAHILVSFFVLFCVCFLKRAEAEEPVNPFQGSQHSENLNCFGDFSLCLSFSQLMFIILPIEYSDFVSVFTDNKIEFGKIKHHAKVSLSRICTAQGDFRKVV